MADRKITQLTAMTAGGQATGDLLTIVDVSEAAAVDKNKKITVESLFKGIPGNVGIGETAPLGKVHIKSADSGGSVGSSADELVIENSDYAGITLLANTQGLINFSDSADVNVGSITYDHSSNFMSFRVNDSERFRVDSSGRLLAGTTASQSTNALVQAYKSSGSVGIHVKGDDLANGNTAIFSVAGRNASGGGYRAAEIGVYKNSSNLQVSGFIRLDPDDGSTNFIYFDNSNLLRFSTASGNIGLAAGTVIGTQTSDERLKNVGADVAYGLAEIKQLQPKQYALKTEPGTNKLGFIAQQVESIIPEAVFDSTDPLPGHEEGDRTKLGMEYVQLIPVLVNAIKELSAEVDTLKTKVAALEAG